MWRDDEAGADENDGDSDQCGQPKQDGVCCQIRLLLHRRLTGCNRMTDQRNLRLRVLNFRLTELYFQFRCDTSRAYVRNIFGPPF